MRMIRSLIYAGLALAAMAFTIASPAVAATPTDPGIYETVKDNLDTPAILQVYDGHAALTCEAPASTLRNVDSQSTVASSCLNEASTPVAVEAYLHIDPDIRARAGI